MNPHTPGGDHPARPDTAEQTSLFERADPSRPTAVVEHDASHRARADASPAGPRDASRDAGGTRRVCAWCHQPIPASARRDAICCSVRCRQARHRFGRKIGHAHGAPVASGRPRRLAYADPPYPGNARLYKDHPDYGGEVDHHDLIRRLTAYDGWALSTSAAALPAVLALCPPGVRVAAWHRGERPTPSRWPLNAWEPVIYVPARPADPSCGSTRRVDSLVHGISPMTTLPGRVVGAKPAAFCRWVFELLGAAPNDTLDDLYPGSGAVSRAWAVFTGHTEPSSQVLRDASRQARADASHPTSTTTAHRTDPAHTPAQALQRDASHPPADTTAPAHPRPSTPDTSGQPPKGAPRTESRK